MDRSVAREVREEFLSLVCAGASLNAASRWVGRTSPWGGEGLAAGCAHEMRERDEASCGSRWRGGDRSDAGLSWARRQAAADDDS